ncbi:hypothetical protein [Nocardia panacis]|uniref:hypothetical protein n=1 Tax=Nocardia panacis TaxID=2340916 RepID=UPI0013157B5D
MVLRVLEVSPRGVGEQDLASAGAGDHVAAEFSAGVAQVGDFCFKVGDDEVDAVGAVML